jgi:hypothetical protein
MIRDTGILTNFSMGEYVRDSVHSVGLTNRNCTGVSLTRKKNSSEFYGSETPRSGAEGGASVKVSQHLFGCLYPHGSAALLGFARLH